MNLTTIVGPAGDHLTSMLVCVANRQAEIGYAVWLKSTEMTRTGLLNFGLHSAVHVETVPVQDGHPVGIVTSGRAGGIIVNRWEAYQTKKDNEPPLRSRLAVLEAWFARLPTCPNLIFHSGGPMRPCTLKIGHLEDCVPE